MRLWSALVESLRAGHDWAWDTTIGVDDAVSEKDLNVAPDSLSVEEAHEFRRCLAIYLDAFGDEHQPLHPQAGQSLRRRVNTNPPFDLTGRADLLFAFDDRAPLVRRLKLRGGPRKDVESEDESEDESGDEHGLSGPTPAALSGSFATAAAEPPLDDVALAVLLGNWAGAALNDVVLRSESLWLRDGRVTSFEVTASHVRAFRGRLYAQFESAIESNVAQPGWWCTSCELLSICPAITSEAASVVVQRIAGGAA